MSAGAGEESAAPYCQATSAPGDGGQSSDDDTLDTPMRGKVLRVLLEWF